MITIPQKNLPKKLMLILTLSISLFCACLPEFVEPLPKEGNSYDNQIAGLWQRTIDTDTQQLQVFPRKDGWLDFVFISGIDQKDSNAGIEVMLFAGYTKNLNDNSFICFQIPQALMPEDSNDPTWYLASYKYPAPDKLQIRMFSMEKINVLIDQGKLKGDITSDQTIVTSSSADLENLLKNLDIENFLQTEQDTIFNFSRPENQKKTPKN